MFEHQGIEALTSFDMGGGAGFTVDAASTITLIKTVGALSADGAAPCSCREARYHHPKLVQDLLAPPGCRIKLHSIPAYCPNLNPIERLWDACIDITHPGSGSS